MLGTFIPSVEDLWTEAGFEPASRIENIGGPDPYRIARAAGIHIQFVDNLRANEITYPSQLLAKIKPSGRSDIDGENILESTWHCLFGHPDRSWYTAPGRRGRSQEEQEARAAALRTAVPDRELDLLLSTNVPKTATYFAGRWDITKRGMYERLDLRGERGLLDDPPRPRSNLGRMGHCADCGKWQRLEPHHYTYIRLGREWDSDGALLCRPCHEERHG